MELREFLGQALEPDPHLRKGQKLITTLAFTRSDLFDRILNERDAPDCYYEDDKIWSTLEWLRKNW